MVATGSRNSCDCFKNIFISSIQHKKIFIIVLVLVLLYTSAEKSLKTYNFDYFIFSQRWLPSACIEYMEHSSSSVEQLHCTLPSNYKIWAIHGLWPTQNNKMGPFFCNNSLPFDLEKLQPIKSLLKLTWPNIEQEKTVDSLWKHEWNKHGTCAAQLKSLNSEFKYFNATLNFFKNYNMQDIFRKNNFAPGTNNSIAVENLISVIQNTTSKLPQIHCIHEVKSKQPYLSEIRLCYNKKLEIMDCRNIHYSNFNSDSKETNGLTNCPLDKKIILPDNVDLQIKNKFFMKSSEKRYYYDFLIDILNSIRFLQWVSI